MSDNRKNYNQNRRNYNDEKLKREEQEKEEAKKLSIKKYKCLVVMVVQLTIVILLLLSIIFFHQCKCRCQCGGRMNDTSGVNVNPSPKDDNSDNKEATDDVDIPVYPTVWNISKDSSIRLSNPATNDVYLEYILSDENNDVFYTSPKIKPGASIQASFYERLGSGAHNCNMAIKSYNIGSDTPNTSVSNSTITIKKFL